MEFNFPEQCTYCLANLRSQTCLLPYEFICRYQPPDDQLSKIMDVTTLHTEYGLSSLQYNLEFVYRIKSRPTSEAIHQYARSQSFSTTDDASKFNEESPIEPETEITPIKNVDKDEIQFEPMITSPLTKEETSSRSVQYRTTSPKPIQLVINESKRKDKEVETYASATASSPESVSNTLTEIVQNTQTQNLEKDQSQHQYLEIPSPEEENHLIHDLVIAISLAHGMSLKHRTEYRVQKLYECLDTEIETKNRTRENYEPKIFSNLDHPIALARELLMSHTDSEIQSWQQGQQLECVKYCVLNYPPLSIGSHTSENDRLVQTLINYCNSVLIRRNYTSTFKERLNGKVKLALELKGNQLAYNWLQFKFKAIPRTFQSDRRQNQTSRPNLMDYKKQLKLPKVNENNESTTTHTCPAVDIELLEMLNSNLTFIINKVISENSYGKITLPDKFSLNNFLSNIVTEFVKHNKSWRNSNSMASVNSLLKASNFAGYQIRSDEAETILWLVSEIVKALRLSIKPKQLS